MTVTISVRITLEHTSDQGDEAVRAAALAALQEMAYQGCTLAHVGDEEEELYIAQVEQIEEK